MPLEIVALHWLLFAVSAAIPPGAIEIAALAARPLIF